MTSPFPSGSPVAAYLRDSGGDEQDLSVEQQEQALRTWCTENNLVLTSLFKDLAAPGSSTVGRTSFSEMIAHFRDPDCTDAGLVVWKFSRFARNMDDAQFYKADLRRRGFIIHSLKDTIPEGINGRFFEAAVDWMNARFIEDMRTDVKRGLQHNLKNFGAIPGTPPFGFKRETLNIGKRRDGRDHLVSRWVPDETKAEIIRTAFQMRAKGSTLGEIHKDLHFYSSINSYHTFFSNRIYTGTLVFGDQVIENYCEPIVEKDIWQAAQREGNGRDHMRSTSVDHPRRARSSFLLSGYLYCTCGSPMHGDSAVFKDKPPYQFYICSRRVRSRDCKALRIPKEIIEDQVVNYLIEDVLTEENMAAHVNHYKSIKDKISNEAGIQIESLSSALDQINRKIKNITNAIAGRENPPTTLIDELTRLELERSEVKAKIAAVENSSRQREYNLQAITGSLPGIIEALRLGSTQMKRTILRGLVDKVMVEREGKTLRIMIEYKLPINEKDGSLDPSSANTMATSVCPQGDSNSCYSLERAVS
jgi:DNA invertase Pin-like site-specific DNA recombinase